MHDAPSEVVFVCTIHPMPQSPQHIVHVLFTRQRNGDVIAVLHLFSNSRVVRFQLAEHGTNRDFFKPSHLQFSLVEGEGAHGLKIDAIQDWLEDTFRTVVGLHRIGENELPAGMTNPVNFIQHFRAIARMQKCILRPDDIVSAIINRNILKIAMDDLYPL